MKPTLEFDSAFADLAPSSTLYINETVNAMWSKGQTVYHMGFGESRFAVHPKLKTALVQYSNKKSYLPARGLPKLCETVASYYSDKLNQAFTEKQVIIGPGSKAIIYGLQMVLDADVFLPTPSWVSYGPQAQLLGKQYHYIPSDVQKNHHFDLAAFDALIKASTKACKLLIINSPNNPTGQMFDDSFLQTLANYCRQQGIWVLSDEIYFEVCHGSIPHVSIAKYYPEATFVLGGLSKHLSIGGWRLGVGLMPDTDLGRQVMQKLVVLASEVWSGVSAPIQYAAIKAYEGDPEVERYVSECRSLHAMRTTYFYQQLISMGVCCTQPQGGFYITVNFDDYGQGLKQQGINSSIDLAAYLLKEHAMATLPGKDFGIPECTYSLRLSTSFLDLETDNSGDALLALYQSGASSDLIMSQKNHPRIHAALGEFSDFLNIIR